MKKFISFVALAFGMCLLLGSCQKDDSGINLDGYWYLSEWSSYDLNGKCRYRERATIDNAEIWIFVEDPKVYHIYSGNPKQGYLWDEYIHDNIIDCLQHYTGLLISDFEIIEKTDNNMAIKVYLVPIDDEDNEIFAFTRSDKKHFDAWHEQLIEYEFEI